MNLFLFAKAGGWLGPAYSGSTHNETQFDCVGESLLGIGSFPALALARFNEKADDGLGKQCRTNVFNVSVADKRTIILSDRKGNLRWFYLTDNSGKLKKAIVNDAALREGGLTNIALPQAQTSFEAQRSIWLNTSSRE